VTRVLRRRRLGRPGGAPVRTDGRRVFGDIVDASRRAGLARPQKGWPARGDNRAGRVQHGGGWGARAGRKSTTKAFSSEVVFRFAW